MSRMNWKMTVRNLTTVMALTIGFVLTQSAEAQTYTVVHQFTNGSDGANPIAGVTVDSAGSLYGTTSAGGRKGFGTVYRLVPSGPNWLFYLVYTFEGLTPNSTDGSAPYSRVVIGPDGFLYGTTHSGGDGQGCKALHGCGTVYQVKPKPGNIWVPWEETILFQFGTADGSNPDYGDVAFDQAGNLYGTTRNGGANLQGAVYELTPNGVNWTESVIYSFAGPPKDGAAPLSGPVLDKVGNLYGTTLAGGAGGWGTAYELKPSGSGWTENIIHSFQNGSDGQTPTGGVSFDPSGNLYGATPAGGTGGGGTVFELTLLQNGNWSLSALYEFLGAGSGSFRTVVRDNAGNLYGTNSGNGVNQWGSVFKLTPSGSGWTYTSLHDFTGGADGGTPYGSLAFDANGNIYGTTSAGGAYGEGVVFQITP